MHEAWENRQLAHVWKLSRRLAKNASGLKKRFFNRPCHYNPTCAEWEAGLQRTGPAGGCDGTLIDWPTEHDRVINATEPPPVLTSTEEHRKLAWTGYVCIRSVMRHTPIRTATPEQGLPNAL